MVFYQRSLLGLLLVMIFVTPFLVSDSLIFGISTAKKCWSYAIMTGLAVFFAVKTIFGTGRFSFSFNVLDLLVIAWCVCVFASLIVKSNVSLFSPLFVTPGLLIILYFSLQSGIHIRQVRTVLILSCLLAGLGQAIYGMLQLHGYQQSLHKLFFVTGSFFNPGPYSGFLVSVFPMALGVYWLSNKGEARIISLTENNPPGFIAGLYQWVRQQISLYIVIKYTALLTTVAIMLMLPVVQSRAAWLAAIAGAFVVLKYKYNWTKKLEALISTTWKKLLVTSAIILLLVALSFILYNIKPTSAYGRLLIWKITIQIILDHPLFGIGYGNYSAVYGAYQAAYFAEHANSYEAMVAGKGEYAFNEYLKIMAEQGLIGFFLFAGVMLSAFQIPNLRRKSSKYQTQSSSQKSPSSLHLAESAVAALTAISVFACFSYPFSIIPIQVNLFFILAILSEKKKKLFTFSPPRIIGRFILPIIFSGIIAIFIFHQIKTFKAYREWNTATKYKIRGNYQGAINIYERIYPVLQDEGEFLFHYGQTLFLSKKYENAIEMLEEAKKRTTDPYLNTALGSSYQALKQYQKAEKNYRFAANLNPFRFYPKYLLAKLYEEKGDEEAALVIAREIIQMEVKVPSPAVKEIKAEMSLILKKYE